MKGLIKNFILLLILFSCEKESKSIINEDSDKKAEEYYLKGEEYYTKDLDSAFVNFNKALDLYTLKKDKRNIARTLIYLSIIQTNKGDFFGSNEAAVDALKMLDEKDTKDRELLVSVYNQLALNHENLKNFQSAIHWYNLALKANTDVDNIYFIKNNIAVSNYEAKNYKTAISILDSLSKSKIYNLDNTQKARIIDNLYYSKFLLNSNYKAETELYQALALREKEKDLWGQNASHAHLSEYFEKTNKPKALLHAKKMYETATELNSSDDIIEAIQKLIVLETPENAKKYFIQYQKLNDSIQIARAKAKNQFALIRYETEKEKSENAKKQNQILKQYVALALLGLAIILGIFWYKKRKKSLEREKELEVKSTALKYSKKVHDVVANGVYQVLSEVENTENLNKETLLDKLETIYEKSRDISYENMSASEENFSHEISNLISSYSNDGLKILIVNDAEIWKDIHIKIKTETKIILQELLVNLKKHSEADFAKIVFEKEKNTLFITYFDNGIGISSENFVKKNGLQNTESRIFSLKGSINFDKNIKQGTKIIITIPI